MSTTTTVTTAPPKAPPKTPTTNNAPNASNGNTFKPKYPSAPMNTYIALFFLALLFLLLVVYYVGTTNDIASFTGATKRIIYWLTGRDPTGSFITLQ